MVVKKERNVERPEKEENKLNYPQQKISFI